MNEIPNLFKKYFQTKDQKSIEMNPNGHGIGLYLIKNIVETMDGTIDVASIQNVETTITVRLKLNKVSSSSRSLISY